MPIVFQTQPGPHNPKHTCDPPYVFPDGMTGEKQPLGKGSIWFCSTCNSYKVLKQTWTNPRFYVWRKISTFKAKKIIHNDFQEALRTTTGVSSDHIS